MWSKYRKWAVKPIDYTQGDRLGDIFFIIFVLTYIVFGG